MICHAADDERRAIESRGDAAEVAMEFVAQRSVGEESKTILRGPHRVDQDVRERLRHGEKDSERADDWSIRQFRASNRKAVPSCSQGCRALARLPWVSRATPPRSASDRNAVPSGGDPWEQGRSGDGTPLGFVIGADRGWCGVPRRASLALATPGLHDASPLGLGIQGGPMVIRALKNRCYRSFAICFRSRQEDLRQVQPTTRRVKKASPAT